MTLNCTIRVTIVSFFRCPICNSTTCLVLAARSYQRPPYFHIAFFIWNHRVKKQSVISVILKMHFWFSIIAPSLAVWGLHYVCYYNVVK